jgi:hypothetical protein
MRYFINDAIKRKRKGKILSREGMTQGLVGPKAQQSVAIHR